LSLFSAIVPSDIPKREGESKKQMVSKTLKVYKVCAASEKFYPHNAHLQALLKFYIESASSIPVDEQWFYFLVYMDN